SLFYPVLQQEMGFAPATISLIFSIYAAGLLVTLLTAGSVSDHVGRRPVISVGFLALALAAYLFWHAGNVPQLLVARALQGIATGLLMPSLSAAAVDLEPRDRPGAAAVWNAVLPLCGLAGGAMFAGILMTVTATPRLDVFASLIACYLVLALAVWLLPETSPRNGGVWNALIPRVGLPKAARAPFWRSAPAVFAGWAIGGLYLSLGTGIVSVVFGIHDFIAEASVILVLAGAGAIGVYLSRNLHQRKVLLRGSASLSIGILLSVAGMQAGSLVVYVLGLGLGGIGFGTCFYGTIRTLIPLAAPHERGELFAALFCLSYTAFGVPTVLAGLVVPVAGLLDTATGYGVIVGLAAALAWVWRRFATVD
ncbi:MAG: MFS transporter, partial [Rhodobacteraceae bacterium]|nr:MFS transporter [Paracoccaceae bacterium]